MNTPLSQTPYQAVAASGFDWAQPKTSEFMNFWLAMNYVLKDRGQPEMLYGEARDHYEQYTGKSFRYGV